MRTVEIPGADEMRWLGEKAGWSPERLKQELAKLHAAEQLAQRWQEMRNEMQVPPDAGTVHEEEPAILPDGEPAVSSHAPDGSATQVKEQMLKMSHQLGETSEAIRKTLISLDRKLAHISDQRVKIELLKKDLGIV